MNLSQHFTYEEMTVSETAARKGIDNNPPPAFLENLKITCQFMEVVRAALRHPIKVTSGYRSPTLNTAIGGSVHSAHCLGYAVDFSCPEFGTPFVVATELATKLEEFDQIIHEYESWVHASFDPRMRKRLLTIRHDGRGYVEGLQP